MSGYEAAEGFLRTDGTTFNLVGGLYAISFVLTGTGTIKLQRLGPDNSTYVDATDSFTTTTGFFSIYLPTGTYKFTIATFTNPFVGIDRIPLR